MRAANPEWSRSRVTIETLLAGNYPGESVVVHYQDYDDTFCSGGPRLHEGEKVLLALFQTPDGRTPEVVWRLNEKVVLDRDEAVRQYANAGAEVGTPEEIVRAAGESLGATSEQIEAAVVAATTLLLPQGGDGPRWTVLAALAAILTVAAGVLVLNRSTKTPPR